MVNKRERLSEQDPAADRPARLPGTGPEGRPQKRPRPDPKARGSLWLRWPVGGSSPWRPVSSPAPGGGTETASAGGSGKRRGDRRPRPLEGARPCRRLELSPGRGLWPPNRKNVVLFPATFVGVGYGRTADACTGVQTGPLPLAGGVTGASACAPCACVCVCLPSLQQDK